MAALNFYAEQPRAFDHGAIEIGLIFAAHTAIAWNMLKRDDQFRSALESRDIIGQAKGMLMERFHIDAVHAFELLKRLSQESNLQLVEVARQLVYAERPDNE
jgi:AmiR/NasT family two-component response regulator